MPNITYTTPGSGTFDKSVFGMPSNHPITVRVWSGSGGGAGGGGNPSGGGGGGRGYASLVLSEDQATYSYSVGAGGATVGPGSAAGNPGEQSWFGSTTTVRASGGVGGGVSGGGNGGAGTHGTVLFTGGNGGAGGTHASQNRGGGGGGSSAGPGGNGVVGSSNSVGTGGAGGDSDAGTGGTAPSGNGTNGTTGGGGGGSNRDDNTGGSGGAGRIEVEWDDPPEPNVTVNFTSAGTVPWDRTTYGVPLGTLVQFESWGGGGGGGGTGTGGDDSGGGGGGGGYGSKSIYIDQDEYTVTVGASGDGGNSGSDGDGGGNSDVYDGSAYVSRATGGSGGGAPTAGSGGSGTDGTDLRNGGAGGAGGNAAGMDEIGGGGGGASAGGNAGSSPTNFAGAAGGTSTNDQSFTGGAGGNSPSQAGFTGTAPGGGGGGAGNRGANSGGDGARGQVSVSWYEPPIPEPEGTGSVLLPPVESDGLANLIHPGSGDLTLPPVESSGDANLLHPGQATITLPGAESDGIGSVVHIGEGDVSLPAVESSGVGYVIHQGSGTVILPSPEADGEGDVPETCTWEWLVDKDGEARDHLDEGLQPETLYEYRIRAFVLDGEDRIYSDWSNIDGDTTPAFPEFPTGTGSVVLPPVESDGQAHLIHPGEGNAVLPGVEASGIGHVIHVSTGTVTLPAVESEGEGSSTTPGIPPEGEGDIVLPPPETEGAGYIIHEGFGMPELPAVISAGVGMMTHFGEATVTLPAVESSGQGHVIHMSEGVVVLPPVESEGEGTAAPIPTDPPVGEGDCDLPAVICDGQGHVIHTSSVTIVLPAVISRYASLPVTNGLQLWYDASQITASDGELLDFIPDLSGNGWNATPETNAGRPAWIAGAAPSGLPVMRFPGVTRAVVASGANNLARNKPGVTTIAIHRPSTVTGNRATIRVTAVGGMSIRNVMYASGTQHAAGGRRLDSDSFQSISTGSGSNQIDTWQRQVTIFRYTQAQLAIRVDGTQVAFSGSFQTAGNTTNTASTDIAIAGASSGTWVYEGDIAEMLVFDRALTIPEVVEIENYLSDKWLREKQAHIIHLSDGDIILPPVNSSGSGFYMGLLPGTVSIVSRYPIIVTTTTEATGGDPPYSYQWQRSLDCEDWVNMSDATEGVSGSTTMTLEDGSAEEGVTYCYRVVITDSSDLVVFSDSILVSIRSDWGLRDPRTRILRIKGRNKEGFQ